MASNMNEKILLNEEKAEKPLTYSDGTPRHIEVGKDNVKIYENSEVYCCYRRWSNIDVMGK